MAPPLTTSYKYVKSSGSASSLWGLELPVTKSESSSYYNPEKRKYKFPASCDYKYKYPGILSQNQSISLSDWQEFMQVFSVVADIVSVASLALDIITYIAAGTGIVGIIIAVIIMIGTAIWTCTQDMAKTRSHVIHYNFDLTGFGGLPSQFGRVEVFEGDIGLAKTVTEFTSSGDYGIWSSTNPALAAKQRYAPWAYGLPKYVTVYDAAGYKVKETYNQYNWAYAKRQLSSIKQSLKCFAKRMSSQRNVNWENPAFYNGAYYSTSNSDILVQFYNFYSGRVLLDTTFERVFKPGSSSVYLETKTAYAYRDDYNYEPYKVSTIQSNGDRIDKTIKFQGDYSGTIMTNLTNANMVCIPVSTSFYIAKANGTSGYTGETVTEFTQLANGDIRPLKVLEQRLDRPTAITLYGGPGSSLTNYKETQSFIYDGNSGIITGVKDESNRSVCNLWGYGNKFVIASVVNANVTSDKLSHTSFEYEGSLNGWSLTGFTSHNYDQTVTGFEALNMLSPSTSLSYALGMPKPYTLSFWSTTNTITVTGGTQSKSAPTINGFTYYEYAIPPSTATVAITGIGIIDELRLYPASARMSTTTYYVGKGKTSDCDANNRITYYEYDNLGRVRFIKDEKRNIVKMYEYNTISPTLQNGCPATYYSKMASETFTKNSCGSGYVGADITFTIPANKYASTISQEDADRKAELDLLTNGQSFANANGSCEQIHYNTAQSTTILSEGCGTGYKGGNVTYTVPANKYSSLISVADANDKALMDIDANAEAYADANPVCVVDTDPAWEEVDESEYCLTVNGALPAHQFMMLKDVNPNSSTYNQTQWIDLGESELCPANTYFSAERSQTFTRNNCGSGGGSSVTYKVPPGKYSSTVSQADADQLAQNDIAANGQDYANANGTCCQPSFTYSSSITSTLTHLSFSGTTVNFTFVFYFPAGYANSTFYLGNLNPACCFPAANRTIPVMIGTSEFKVFVSSSGRVDVQHISGTYPSGVNGLVSSYDLNANAFYSVAKSGTFTRNNCPAGQVGTSVTYNVPKYRYSSLISQADADQKAQNDVTANGQSYANANGTCNTVCSFTWQTGITGYNANITSPSPGTSVNFRLVFPGPSNNYYGGTVGTISAPCRPSVNRYMIITDAVTPGRSWSVTITTAGVVQISLYSGTAPNAGVPPIDLSGTFTK
ncbi:MAG: hypothetical protein KF746_11935 [Chitinophagaceae bacterium]|nr:hypothetical protein [Chitinophagaceae bacterium]